MHKWIFRAECFAAYGLNKGRNFLEYYEDVDLFGADEWGEWAMEMLSEYDCDNAAIFGIAMNGDLYIGITDVENDQILFMSNSTGDFDIFANIDAECRLCCYGLVIETSPGYWTIVKE